MRLRILLASAGRAVERIIWPHAQRTDDSYAEAIEELRRPRATNGADLTPIDETVLEIRDDEER